jgi:hypothetical protein
VRTTVRLAERIQDHLAVGRLRSPAPGRTAPGGREGRRREAAWGRPGVRSRGARRPHTVAAPHAGAVPRGGARHPAGRPRGGAARRAAGRPPGIACGRAAPWAAGAGGLPGQAAGPSRGPRNRLLADGVAMAAARPSGPARPGPRCARRGMHGHPQASRTLHERSGAPTAPSRRTLTAAPTVAARRTLAAVRPVPARQALGCGRRGERPAGRAVNTPSSGSVSGPGADVNGTHEAADLGRVSQRPLDRGPARGMLRHDADGRPDAGGPPCPDRTGPGPCRTSRPASRRTAAGSPGPRRRRPRPRPGPAW